MESRCKLFC